jgi:hypothetical protein
MFDMDGDGIISLKDILDYTNSLHSTDRFLKKDALMISKFIEEKFNPPVLTNRSLPYIKKSTFNYLHAPIQSLRPERRKSSKHTFALPSLNKSVEPAIREPSKKIILKLSKSNHPRGRQKSLMNIFDFKKAK